MATAPVPVTIKQPLTVPAPIKVKDSAALKKIEKLDIHDFFKTLRETNASICGYGPIGVLISVAKQLNLKPKIIHKSNSGEVTNDSSQVVTYIAISFE